MSPQRTPQFNEAGEKACTCCREFRPLSDYFIVKTRKNKPSSRCRPCLREEQREYRRRTPRSASSRHAQYEKYKGRPGLKQSSHRSKLKRYGLSETDYARINDFQNGLCAICSGVCASGTRLSVDHCHATGVVRGLLCKRCNTGLGGFRDDPELLEKARAYLWMSVFSIGRKA